MYTDIAHALLKEETVTNNRPVFHRKSKTETVCSLRTCFVMTVTIVCVILFLLQFMDQDQLINPFIFHTQKRRVKFSPVILSWTKFFGSSLSHFMNDSMKNCPVQCVLTDDRSKLQSAGAVLFHIRDLRPNDLPINRSQNQLFTFFLLESPHHTGGALSSMPKDYFNITLTYRLDSDAVFSYGKIKLITNTTAANEKWEWEQVEDIVGNKTKSVLQFVSNCETPSRREKYVKELRKHIQFTQYGYCGNGTCRGLCEITAIAEHRFYLAFENSVCRDYVTEKFFSRIARLMIPIVLQKSNYNNIVPEGSYIAAVDFESPKHLADYLHYLENNKTAFLRYFEWTRKYEKNIDAVGTCELCKLLHKGVEVPKIIPNIWTWWKNDAHCIPSYGSQIIENHGLKKTRTC